MEEETTGTEDTARPSRIQRKEEQGEGKKIGGKKMEALRWARPIGSTTGQLDVPFINALAIEK